MVNALLIKKKILIEEPDFEWAKILLKHKAILNPVMDKDKNTLLHHAVSSGKPKLVQFLLENKVDVNVRNKKSIADKLTVNLNPKTITFKIIQDYVDYFIMPTEKEIRKAMKEIHEKTGELVEGAGAIAYAAALKDKRRKDNVCCIVSGGNIDSKSFSEEVRPSEKLRKI